MRYFILMGTVVSALFGYYLVWNRLADRVLAETRSWIAERRAAGLQVEHGTLHVDGFPFRLQLTIPNPAFADPRSPSQWRWQGTGLTAYTQPWTINHVILAKTDAEVAMREIQQGRALIEQKLGAKPMHFSFPFGDPTSAGPREFARAKELGFKTAVTTRPGVLFPEHRDHLMALPRISINGDYQRLRYVDVLLSGAATAVWNGFRRVNAA